MQQEQGTGEPRGRQQRQQQQRGGDWREGKCQRRGSVRCTHLLKLPHKPHRSHVGWSAIAGLAPCMSLAWPPTCEQPPLVDHPPACPPARLGRPIAGGMPAWKRREGQRNLGRQAEATLEMVYAKTQWPSDAVVASMWDLHRIRKDKVRQAGLAEEVGVCCYACLAGLGADAGWRSVGTLPSHALASGGMRMPGPPRPLQPSHPPPLAQVIEWFQARRRADRQSGGGGGGERRGRGGRQRPGERRQEEEGADELKWFDGE